MKNYAWLMIFASLALGACSPKPMTVDDYLKNSSAIQPQMNACDKALEQALLSSHSDQDLKQKINGIQDQCNAAMHARDILIAGHGVDMVHAAEPYSHATVQFFEDGLAAQTVRQAQSELRADQASHTAFGRSSVQYDEQLIKMTDSKIKDHSITPDEVAQERRWCREQSLYRDIIITAVSPACKNWIETP